MFNLRKILGGGKNRKIITLASPLEGEVVSLSDVPDPTFADELLGKGIAILPSKGRVVSPAKGKVDQVFETGHAVTIVSKDNIEILIHIGLDTVKLKGEHYTKVVKDGQLVDVGDVLIEFDVNAIIAAGYEVITPVVICNSGDYRQFEPTTKRLIKEGDKLISFSLKEEKTL